MNDPVIGHERGSRAKEVKCTKNWSTVHEKLSLMSVQGRFFNIWPIQFGSILIGIFLLKLYVGLGGPAKKEDERICGKL